jgi:hypothetical protein
LLIKQVRFIVLRQNHALTGLLLLASLSVIATAPAIAAPAQEQVNNPESETLIAQLLGHNTYQEGGEQLNLSDYTLGHVRGRSGNYLSIELMDMSGTEIKEEGGRVIMAGSAQPGDDVLLIENDGEYEFVGTAEPTWITKLQKDYGWKMAAETKGVALSERTASLWQALAQNEGRTITIAPLGPDTNTGVGGEVPEEPVRGMW